MPKGANEDALVLLSDIFPTGLECGVLNGKMQLGNTVVIVGAGPVGLAATITSQLYSPSIVIMIDMDENCLKVAESLRAHHTIDPSDGKAVEAVKALTDQKGCDAVIEAVGIPETFELNPKSRPILNGSDAKDTFELIPIVDVGEIFSPDLGVRKKIATEIGRAVKNVGFFYAVNPPVSTNLMGAYTINYARFSRRPTNLT